MEIWEEGNNRPEVIEGIEMVMERGVEEEVGKWWFNQKCRLNLRVSALIIFAFSLR